MTTSTTLRAAHAAWKLIPSQRLRAAAFAAFLRMVRSRKATRTVDGVVYHLDLGELIDVGLFLNRYEPDVTLTIEALTRTGDTVIDIGANIGAHTLRFARKVGTSGRVVAYEPMPYACNKLRRNLEANAFPHVVVRPVGLGEEPVAAATVQFRASWRTDGQPRQETATVQIVTLDEDLAALRIARVDLIKLDVDGLEAAVLRGGLATLRRDRPLLLMEVSRTHFASDAANPLSLLASLGYRFWHTTTAQEFASWGDARAFLEARAAAHLDSLNVIAAVSDVSARLPRAATT